MAMRHEHDPHGTVAAEPAIREETTMREPFSLAQVVTFAAGVANIVFGAIALIRVGTENMTGPTTEVAGLQMTGALAVAHLIIGVLALMGTASRGVAISSLALVGPILIVAGIIALIERVEWLGWTESNGVAYLIMGTIALGTAAFTRDVAFVEQRLVRLHH